jgi:hypothetical protein
MKTFFTDFKRSLTDWNWYKEIAAGQHPLKISYAVILSLFAAFVASIAFAVGLYTFLIPTAKDFINTRVPADLVITLKSGSLSINQPMPYRLEMPKEEKGRNGEERANIFVIDTNVEATLEAPEKYDTYIFISKDKAVMEKSANEIRAYPLKDFPDTTVSRESLNTLLDKIISFAWVLPILILIPLMVFMLIGILIIFLVAGFVLWLIMKLASRPIRFSHAFALAMYAYTFIFLLDIVLIVLGHGGFGFISSVFLTVAIVCFPLFFLYENK